MDYLIFKALHIIAFVCWFAGLFYLPRLFVYHTQNHGTKANNMLSIMEHKLYKYITTPAMILTWLFGLGLLHLNPTAFSGGWLHVKLTLVVILSAYHGSLGIFYKRFKNGKNAKSERFYRLWNEVPSVILVAVVFLAVLKPF